MNINSDLLISSKTNGTIYANDFKCKNLLPIIHFQTWHCTYTISDNVITLKPTEVGGVSFLSLKSITLPAGIYTISFLTSGNFQQVSFLNIVGGTISKTSSTDRNFTFEISGSAVTFNVAFYVNTSSISNSLIISSIQIEHGVDITPWTPYKSFENDQVILFNNPSGLFDDISLNDARTNYSKLEIYFLDDQNFQNTMTIDSSSNPFQLQFLKSGANRGAMYLVATRMRWNSTTLLKRDTTTVYNIINSQVSENTTADVLKITKIIGYK